MPVARTRHGDFDYEEDQVLHVAGGLLGFPDALRFLLLENADVEPLRWLVSLDRPELTLLVIDPRLLVADFQIRLGEEDCERLDLQEGDDSALLPLAITVLAERGESSTANLKAPVIVNTRRMRAAQIVLLDAPYSVQHPLLPRSA